MPPEARALWIEAAGRAALRAEPLPGVSEGQALVETLFSGVSRGTEALVLAGRVPAGEATRMRAPFQTGDFPFPVKYGYAAVGRVEAGPAGLAGRTVFCLHPHQDRFVVPADALVPVPETVPPKRAVLAANMETALNIVWDAGVLPGDRVAVIGGGVVGLLAAWLAAAIPATDTVVVEVDPARGELAAALGLRLMPPDRAPEGCDIVIHASASEAGLAEAIRAAGFEARIVEASWYGEGEVPVPLGGAFHSQRLRLVASQVGHVPPARRGRWTRRRRMETALALLADPRLDALVSGETPFRTLAEDYAAILAAPETLLHRIRYPAAE